MRLSNKGNAESPSICTSLVTISCGLFNRVSPNEEFLKTLASCELRGQPENMYVNSKLALHTA